MHAPYISNLARGNTLPPLVDQRMHNQMHGNSARGNTLPSLVHQRMHNEMHKLYFSMIQSMINK